MKDNEIQNQDVMAVYEAYWETYLRGDIQNWASLVDDDFRIIGTTDGEIFYNKKEALAFYEATADQIAGKAKISNSFRKTKSWDGLTLITEIADLYILLENKWTFYSKFRLSSLLKKKPDGWKFIQQHGSIPDTRAEEGEQVATKKIQQENLELRDAVKRRTIELEHKNRELEIEASLERVRSIAMGMKEPADMLDVCKIISEQLELFNINDIRNVQTAIIDESKGTYLNYQYFTAYKKTVFEETEYDKHPTVLAMVQEMKKSAEAYFFGSIEGQALETFRQYRKQDNQFDDPLLDETRSVHYYFFSIGKGGLGITTYHPLPEPGLAIFKRFHNVFNLAYRRFEDLKSAERQNRIIQADNERKSRELEEARQMQLSMLPKEIPQLEHFEIAVYMKTATEVGGDYYDFSFREDGSFNIALGDATGHGMKAGIMVSSMKSIFTTNSPKMNIDDFFRTANNGIKSMNLKRMMMGFTMLNMNSDHFQLINAGMPPVFLYHRSSKTVEEIKEHGVPIGAMNHIQFKTIHGNVEKGDVFLLLTDGMPELQNQNGDMYGYEQIHDGFKKIAEKEPKEIVQFLKNEGSAWIDDRDPEDDVTFVVIKAI